MSVIFPGNYVAHLNAYRDQGVYAIPGIEFYQVVGAAIIDSDVSGSGTLNPEIQSPDLRQDDKPRLNKPVTVPAGATVYRTAINADNVATTGTSTIAVDGLTTGGLEASLPAVDGVFPPEGGTVPFDGFATVSAENAGATITVTHSGDLTVVDPDSQAAILVEVCYYIVGDAPDADDTSLPYKVEAGQGY
tara:strand:- start:327 stop:896 length:570 start_codon:yes stop_codon:yes gene_type:complete